MAELWDMLPYWVQAVASTGALALGVLLCAVVVILARD